ncbi:MAG: Lrp/AsnC ligand binding domain-containing protein [Saprospiraceae bacterium]
MGNKTSILDKTDRSILSILMMDAKTPYAEMSKQLSVSTGTVHARIKKMIDIGLINGSHLTVDYKRLGYDVTAFLGIYLEKSEMYMKVSSELKKIPEVVSAHYTTGVYSIFAKIICRDTDHLRSVLSNSIQSVKGIQRTETFISLHESINRPLILDNIKI